MRSRKHSHGLSAIIGLTALVRPFVSPVTVALTCHKAVTSNGWAFRRLVRLTYSCSFLEAVLASKYSSDVTQ